MRIRRLATGAALGALVSILLPSLALPAGAEPCPTGQPPGRTPGRNAAQGQPATGRPSEYPLGQCQLLLSQSAGAAGTRVGVSGNGFAPGSTVQVAAGSTALASAVADAAGNFATKVAVPAGLTPGDHTITATGVNGASEPRELTANFTVLPSSASRGAGRTGSLPRTGSSATAPLVATGAGLVALGVVAVIGARRRHARSAA